MQVTLGEAGLEMSWQGMFNETAKCHECGGQARIMFVAHEGMTAGDMPGNLKSQRIRYIVDLHDNGGPGDYWPHDCIAVAVYLCRECFTPIADINQG